VIKWQMMAYGKCLSELKLSGTLKPYLGVKKMVLSGILSLLGVNFLLNGVRI